MNNDVNQTEIQSTVEVLDNRTISKNDLIAPSLYRFDIQSILMEALKNNPSVETLERLMAMRRELTAERARQSFIIAMAAFKAECPIIKKNKTVYDKNKTARYKYAPLEDIVSQVDELITKYGFSYSFDSATDGKSVTSIIYIQHIEGHSERRQFTAPVDFDSYMNLPQKFASARTFARRYVFCDGFGILTEDEDDDANTAGPAEKGHQTKGKPIQSNTINQSNTSEQSRNLEAAPEENQALFKTLMALLNEKESGKSLFSQEEKILNKKNIDAIINNFDGLKVYYKTINKLAQDRRAAIRVTKK